MEKNPVKKQCEQILHQLLPQSKVWKKYCTKRYMLSIFDTPKKLI